MVRIFKQLLCVVVLALAVRNASAYSLLGDYEPYQVPIIGYALGGDLGGPMNLAEEYRRNIPVLYYTFDENFINYFGTNGITAIEEAFTIMNGLTNLSGYSADVSEFPLEAQRYNFLAQALSLTDLKSVTLSLLVEEMGLAEPDRFTWCLHDRLVGNGGCPANVSYTVIKRNFDPAVSLVNQFQSSSYVNGTLYSYQIVEFCTGPNPLADAVEFPVDPLANTFTAVAAFNITPGSFYTGLTRDDVAGLRYLMRTNNYNVEQAGAGTTTFITNTTPQLLFTSNLFEFVNLALVSDPATLAGLYPNLQILSSTEIFTNLVTTNLIFYFTNYPFEPFGSPPHLMSATVLETNITIFYNHTFGNAYITPSYQLTSNFQVPVVPGHSSSNAIVTIITTNISTTACGAFGSYGSVCTNITTSQELTPGFFGDFYILPTNLCSVSIIATQLIANISVTNDASSVTVVFTNAQGAVVATNSFFSQTPIYSFNQYIYLIRPVTCPANTVALRQGINRVRYVRRDFDSLVGQFFYPITNQYVLMAVTNNSLIPQTVQRVVIAPDVLLTAQDLATDPADGIIGSGGVARNISYNAVGAGAGLTGPGTINNPIVFTYNKVGPIYGNVTPASLDEATQIPLFFWGSFDGSTNLPVVYPNGTSIENIENQVLIQVNPAGPALPDAIVALNYTNNFGGFSVVGGTAPYSWTLTPGSPALPLGLTLNSVTGRISGVPFQQGIYDFSVRLTDANSRIVDRAYSIAVTP